MRSLAWLGLSLFCVACQAGAAIGTPCSLSSQCAAPLVCRIGRCRTECVEARDCPAGQVCLLDANHLGACELPTIDVCASSCDPPLVCAAGHCRVECAADGDCPRGHVCVSNACQRSDVAIDAGSEDAGANDTGPTDTGLTDTNGPDANPACDPVGDMGCTAANRCSVGTGVPACVARGTATRGADCTADTECAGGLSCQGSHCVRICVHGNGAFCGQDLTCSFDSVHGQVTLNAVYGIGLCSEPCDLLTDMGCTHGGSCALGTDGEGRDFTWCRDVRTMPLPASAEGGTCSVQSDCEAGLYCYTTTTTPPTSSCRRFCDPTHASATCPGQTCDLITRFTSQAQVGACIP